jgi:hypothetical protein
LDVNVLLALTWPVHVHHRGVEEWFLKHHGAGFSTCPMTQAGFVRISCNASYSEVPVTPVQALTILNRITELKNHLFWPDQLPLAEAIGRRPVTGHRQITDAYLIALAEKNGGILATLDRAALSIGGPVELVGRV